MNLIKKSNLSLENLKFIGLRKTEDLACTLNNELENKGITLKPGSKVFNTVAYTLGIMLFVEKKVFASAPSTGFPGLDAGAWKIVKVFQAAVFWVALLYTLKSLLLLAVKGEGDWKDVATGFFICLGDYLAPWLFSMVPGLFNF